MGDFGIALDCMVNEAWVVGAGNVSHLGNVPCGTPTSVEEDRPQRFRLSAAYPNPFSIVTSFLLTVEEPQRVRVAVYDLFGREVEVLHNGVISAGEASFSFDGRNLPSALYLVRVDGERFSASQRVILVK